MKVCVYCASSQRIDRIYLETARSLGGILAKKSVTIVYGGGGTGAMGAVADGSLEQGGHVIGVIPRFMVELEWGHSGIQELKVVDSLHERKRLMLEDVDACVALPGGSGTLEELLEAITLKRLGIFLEPIVLLNLNGFYDPLLEQFERCVSEQFMDERHRLMWRVVERPEDVVDAIEGAPDWSSEARNFASLR
jgi:uncharacterized protein (TIGR00730 family)